jgi:hypothetical protein
MPRRCAPTPLGLAGAYAFTVETAKSKTAYHDFLVLWKDADIDVDITIRSWSEPSCTDSAIDQRRRKNATNCSVELAVGHRGGGGWRCGFPLPGHVRSTVRKPGSESEIHAQNKSSFLPPVFCSFAWRLCTQLRGSDDRPFFWLPARSCGILFSKSPWC